ncbi:hypothetical protein ORI20_26105 [Mycobacterium sp. CVI_P3]|uniref:MalT-like winged helix domain-containing protein n=1 Tax=Mycobacterium pinniadriaticum TaxID=2994102 RepID=A0ABT3SKY5_9MYCO|nr:hypothetical protein [Mycobacterium pinniadriaticum]MCX2933749.1 hypothetical protein [Mycobacterium pinniadriaticum]MCX2940171.1 hypothetical protein [Mycobacterium pinniadriaticum]
MDLSSARPLPTMIRQKVVPPGLPATAIARPRLDELYTWLLEEHDALAVFATAGSGKTIQAQLFAAREQWPLAWLTLDEADGSASRMLSYLARALRPYVPGIEAVLESAFATEPTPEVVAALLAEAIESQRLLIVIDQCEVIADSVTSCSVLESFLYCLPGGVRVLLLSRQEMKFSLGRLLLHGRIGRISDDDLAVTADEAQLFLTARDDTTEVSACLERTNGWFAAVAFGAAPQPGGHDLARDFSSYIAAEVFDVLPPDERQFLLDTSILDTVSVDDAIALCGNGARAQWHTVRMRHLPATSSTNDIIVYHPCFRSFLREHLELTDPERLSRLRCVHAELLCRAAHYEDATELLLEIGHPDEAISAVESACRQLIDRSDWTTVLRWTDALGAERTRRSPVLLGALIPALRSARRLEEARTLIRELHADGRLADVLATDGRLITHVAWTMLWRPQEGLDLLDRYDTAGNAAGARYMLEVTTSAEPVEPVRGSGWNEVDRLVSWGLMVQGRLDDLVAMLPTEDRWPPRTPYTTPHPLLGLVWRGELDRAKELFDQVPEEFKRHIHTDLWYYLEAWLLLARDDPQGALVAAEQAIAHSRRTHFGFEPVFQIVYAEALLSLGRTDDAVAVLTDSIETSRFRGLRAYEEWGQTLLGHALLLKSEDTEAAALLTSCVDAMSGANRLLLLPAATIFLAEAHRRLGRPETSLEIADHAYQIAKLMGSFFGLKRALDRVPDLRAQLLRQGDSKWRRVTNGPNLIVKNRNPDSNDGTLVLIQPFGAAPDIHVNGRPVGIRRLKMLELASFLAARPSGVARDDIIMQLFPDSDRNHASNHFRQVVHQLRKTAGLTLQRLPASRIAWSDSLSVDSADRQFERALNEAPELAGEARLSRLREALDQVVGPYLLSSDLEWVSDRRFELDVMAEDAELETARLALDLDDLDCARRFAERVLVRDVYSEAAYRVLIAVDTAIGAETSALATYRRAVAALREIGLAPSEATARLLRRPPDQPARPATPSSRRVSVR